MNIKQENKQMNLCVQIPIPNCKKKVQPTLFHILPPPPPPKFGTAFRGLNVDPDSYQNPSSFLRLFVVNQFMLSPNC